nr:hypothetical protein [Tanacetum cinerariifolium]
MRNKDESGNTMVLWYTRMGDMIKVIDTFGNMQVRNLASWVATVSGYVDIENMEIARNFYDVMPARELFNEMNGKDHLVCWIKNTLLKQMRITLDDHLATAFIDLYVKCGRVDKAYDLFYGLQKKLLIY